MSGQLSSVPSLQTSRDPAGMDPSGVDIVAGADPPPDGIQSRFLESDPPILPPIFPEGPPPPTPRRTHGAHRGAFSPSPVMAFLVGEPPPPPQTPPPLKHRAIATARHHNLAMSPPGDSSATMAFSSLSSSICQQKRESESRGPRKFPTDSDSVHYVDQKRREALAIYESPVLYIEEQELIPCTSCSSSREKIISDDLVQGVGVAEQSRMDGRVVTVAKEQLECRNTSASGQQLGRHMLASVSVAPPTSPGTTDFATATAVKDKMMASKMSASSAGRDNGAPAPMLLLASPTSAATEPHSNKRGALGRNSKQASASSQESVDLHSSDSSSKANTLSISASADEKMPKKKRGRLSTGGKAKIPEKLGGRKTPESSKGVDTHTTDRSEKRGFFRKIFRVAKRKSIDLPSGERSEADATDEDATKSKAAIAAGALTSTPGDTNVAAGIPVLPPRANHFPDVSASQITFSKSHSYGRFGVRLKDSDEHLTADDAEKPNETARCDELNASPNADVKELELRMGLETITSALTNDTEPDRKQLRTGLQSITPALTNGTEPGRGEIFFAHDEVSTLTAPSAQSYGRNSVDPIEGTVMSALSCEPVGHYWNAADNTGPKEYPPERGSTTTIDPFTEPFFKEPDGESPVTSTKANNLNYQQHVEGVPCSQDPAGETPRTKPSIAHMNEPSPRGWESPITELKDPLGSTIVEAIASGPVPAQRHGRSEEKPVSKIPPTQDTAQVDLRREPSAFHDKWPNSLDPPLHADEEEEDSKILGDVFFRFPRSTTRIAAKPPSPTTVTSREEVQSAMPSIKAEPELRIHAGTSIGEEDFSRALPHAELRTAENPKELGCNVELDAEGAVLTADRTNATVFMENIFQEKSPSPLRRSSIVRPISIKLTSATGLVATKQDKDNSDSPSTQSSQGQLVEGHRTQRLSLLPRSRKNASCTRKKKNSCPVTGIGETEGSRYSEKVAMFQGQRVLKEDEEKKEPDHLRPYSIVDRPLSPQPKLATSTAALGTAACMNAKTMSYLHTLNGEPSPRHSWRRPNLSDDEYSPPKSVFQRKAVSNLKPTISRHSITSGRTDEAAFDDFISLVPVKEDLSLEGKGTKHDDSVPFQSSRYAFPIREKDKRGFKKSFTVCSKSKLSTMLPKIQHHSKVLFQSGHVASSPRRRLTNQESYFTKPLPCRINRDVQVAGTPLVLGLDLIRRRRLEDILNGVAVPVHKPKEKVKAADLFLITAQDVNDMDEDNEDPIQRAGRRLLTKAAIPIQSSARRYLAKRRVSIRVEAIIVLQAYLRRWKCEAYLRAYKYTCVRIQASVRSWVTRNQIAYQHFSASQIQKAVRGFIARMCVSDAMFLLTRLQAAMRGKMARLRFKSLVDLRRTNAVRLQAWYRGSLVAREAWRRKVAICAIQARCRAFLARVKYQLSLVDVIVTQSCVRQLLSRRVATKKRLDKMNHAACRIQATWRGFQGYTDYIFALVDILVLQRNMRKWLAKNQLLSRQRERSAIKIQAQWRRQTALIGMLYDLVHIIIAQSVVRRYLAKRIVLQRRVQYARMKMYQEKLESAAEKIQSVWRGFWGYSHFVIMQYEIIRLQAIIRGRASRILFSLKLGCCIMIQSAVRLFLANKKTVTLKIARVSFGSSLEGLRIKLACRRVQFWWRVVMECGKEKKAALVIERFFLMVKAEVDKEILRQQEIQTKLSIKSRKVASQRKHEAANDAADEKLLEHVWMYTVDEDHDGRQASRSHSIRERNTNGSYGMVRATNAPEAQSRSGRSRSAPRLHHSHGYMTKPSRQASRDPAFCTVKHHPSSPTINLVMRHEYDESTTVALRREQQLRVRKEEALQASRRIHQRSKPAEDVTLSRSDERTEVSAITSPTVFKTTSKQTSRICKQKRPKIYEDGLSLEESLLGEEILEARSTTHVQSSALPQKVSRKHHFFSDDTKNPVKSNVRGNILATQQFSVASTASEVRCSFSEDVGEPACHLYSRTATTVTRTTTASHSEASDSGASTRSVVDTDVDMRKTVNQGLSSPTVDQKFGADKYTSAARKETKTLTESPRHGRIVVTNACNDFPILSQDSRDNVEVELVAEPSQFGEV